MGQIFLVKTSSESGGTLQVRLDDRNGKVLSEVKIPKSIDWNILKAELNDYPSGEHNLAYYERRIGKSRLGEIYRVELPAYFYNFTWRAPTGKVKNMGRNSRV